MKFLNLKSAVLGILLIGITFLVLVLFRSNDQEDSVIMNFSETEVLDTISQLDLVKISCSVTYKKNSDERDRYTWHERTYGNTWGLPDDDKNIYRAVIDCDTRENLEGKDWDKWGTEYKFRIRYPLIHGKHSELLNSAVREDVSGMIYDYVTYARDRNGFRKSNPYISYVDAPDHYRRGHLSIYGFASFANEGIYSVHLESDAHDPGANTSPDYLRTLNFDLETGERFSLLNLLKPGPKSFTVLQIAAVQDHNEHYLKGVELGVHMRNCCAVDLELFYEQRLPYSIETLREQQFSLTKDAIALDCLSYCDKSIAPYIMFKNNALEVKFDEIEGYFNPDGPIRHFSL